VHVIRCGVTHLVLTGQKRLNDSLLAASTGRSPATSSPRG